MLLEQLCSSLDIFRFMGKIHINTLIGDVIWGK